MYFIKKILYLSLKKRKQLINYLMVRQFSLNFLILDLQIPSIIKLY